MTKRDMAKEEILIVDDEPVVRWTLAEALRSWGYQVVEADTVATALSTFEAHSPALVLLDIHLPDGSGLEALREIKQRQPDAVVIMITSEVIVENLISALRGGAYDFIGKPIRLEELQVTLRNGLEARALRTEVHSFRRERSRHFSFDQIIGNSPALKEIIQLARRVAESGAATVLLQGESGTGKDLIAKAIHYASRRADHPFITINCAAIPATLLESELFGYEKGAFTDAKTRKEGLFEQAEGGTLFLDEIGELELSLQAKLLRVLEDGAFRRVGGLKDVPLDVRIIASTNRDLKAASEVGAFRLDLYYRLSVIQIDIPPLCERGEDVILLADHYIHELNKQFGRHLRGLTPEVKEIFRAHRWRGNVRELRNVIERVMILEEGDLITTKYLPRGFEQEDRLAAASSSPMLSDAARRDLTAQTEPSRSAAPAEQTESPSAASGASRLQFEFPPEGIVLEQLEMQLVQQALQRSGGNQTRAAELLGISRDQLRYRLKKLEDAAE